MQYTKRVAGRNFRNADTRMSLGARCWWRIWLRHCATSRKVAGSIPDEHNTSGHNEPLRKMSTRRISWGEGRRSKGGRRVGLTTLSPSFADRLEIYEPQNSAALKGLSRAFQRLLYRYFCPLGSVFQCVYFLHNKLNTSNLE